MARWRVLLRLLFLPGYYDSFEEALEVASAYSGGFVGYYDGDFRALYGNYYSANEAANAAYSSAPTLPAAAVSL